jgi:hypothetical protein
MLCCIEQARRGKHVSHSRSIESFLDFDLWRGTIQEKEHVYRAVPLGTNLSILTVLCVWNCCFKPSASRSWSLFLLYTIVGTPYDIHQVCTQI